MEFAGMATRELAVSSGSFDTKERVKQAVDIVDLVGSHIQLRRQGRNYVGLCPWHDDTRPSLQVNPERQSFKCWVCDIGGDVFSFVMKMEGVEFREALQMLADRAGIPVGTTAATARGRRPYGRSRKRLGGFDNRRNGSQDKRTLLQAMAWAEKQYHQCLLESPEADAARRYLQERGITAESIERFHLGFSPLERDWILRQRGRRSESRETGAAGEDLGDDRHSRPAGRGRKPLRPLQGPVAVLDPRRPGPAGGHRRPGVAGTGHDQPGQVRQFARNAAVHQEQAALRPRPGPRGPAKNPHGLGDGGLHRRDRRPPVRVPERGGRAGHGVGRVAHPPAEGPRRSDRVGARRRRGRHAPGQRSVGTVHRPAGRSADPHPARRPRSVRLPAQVRGRGVLPNCWPPRRSTPWTTPTR